MRLKPTFTRRRQLRVNPVHDDALKEIAKQRGCDVSDLYREAVEQQYLREFILSSYVSQTRKTQAKRDRAGVAR